MDNEHTFTVFICPPQSAKIDRKNAENLTAIECELVEMGFATVNASSLAAPFEGREISGRVRENFKSIVERCDLVFRPHGSDETLCEHAVLAGKQIFSCLQKLRRWLENGWLDHRETKNFADFEIENDAEWLDKLTTADIFEIVENEHDLLFALKDGPYTNAQMSIAWAGIWHFIAQNELAALQMPDDRSVFEIVRDTLQRWKNGYDEALEHVAEINNAVSKSQKLDNLKTERGKIYGDARENHRGIAQMWAPLLAPHAEAIADLQPIPEWTVALLMAALKVARCRLVFHEDNYDDAANYLDFAHAWQMTDARNSFE